MRWFVLAMCFMVATDVYSYDADSEHNRFTHEIYQADPRAPVIEYNFVVDAWSGASNPFDRYDILSSNGSAPVEFYFTTIGENGKSLSARVTCDFSKGATEAEANISVFRSKPTKNPNEDGIVIRQSFLCSPLSERDAKLFTSASCYTKDKDTNKLKCIDEAREQEDKKYIQEKSWKEDRDSREACITSPNYLMADAAHRVVAARGMIRQANMLIAAENKIGDQSGYVNAKKLHDFVAGRIYAEQVVAEYTAIYKKLGGKLPIKDPVGYRGYDSLGDDGGLDKICPQG